MRKYLVVFTISLLATVLISTLTSKSSVAINETREVNLVFAATQTSTLQLSNSPIPTPSISNTSFSNANGNINILDWLRDSIWQSIGVLLAVVAIIVSVIIFFLQKSKKLLTYEILSETSLLSVAKEVEDKIQILFEGNAVKGVHLILLQISNVGNTPILPIDFLKDLTISFDGSAKVLSAEIVEKNPQSIDVNLTINHTQLIISPSLWNSGDTITVKSLVSEFNENIQVSGRIVGIQDIKVINTRMLNPSTAVFVSLGTILILAGIILSALTKQPNFLALAAIGYIFTLLPVFFDKKYREFISNVFTLMLKELRLRII